MRLREKFTGMWSCGILCLVLLGLFGVAAVLGQTDTVRAERTKTEEVKPEEEKNEEVKPEEEKTEEAKPEEEKEEQTPRVYSHGTTDKEITKKMLKDTPPEDYQVDMSIQGDAKDGAYDEYFLKDKIQTVSIKIDENNLNYLLQNATFKPTVMTDSVTIGDKTVGYTGLKTKGHYTLRHSFSDNIGSDRFSFTVNFGKYIKKENYGVKQNFFGCRKISFNNLFFDKTMMKEYVSLTLMTQMGLPTPQYGLAKLYINDKFYGVYFMLESYDQSILEQFQKADKKEISDYMTKPEHTSLLYDEKMDQYLTKDGTFDLSSDLKIKKDGTYQATGTLKKQEEIWEGEDDTLQDVAGMLPTVFLWQRKLNQLSEGKNFEGKEIDVNSDEYVELLEQIMDVDEVVRYFAAHSFLVQIDDMFDGQQNYGLYVDETGKCMVLPWDYDLSFGCFFPSTAEKTANFDLDLMYKRGQEGFAAAAEKEPAEMYKDFPLFHVIYQNDSLMEKYHGYMKDCSKIAALGGRTFSGETYEPVWFHSLIEKIKEPLIEAASEELGENVYYMNFINQPSGVKLGLPNLSKIIAMRSVGVMSQVDGIDTTVCGYGCNLETLGNAVVGENSNGGVITAVDDTTGIFVMADYGKTDWTQRSPSLKVSVMGEKTDIFRETKKKTGCDSDDLIVYQMVNTADPDGNYTLSVPLSKSFAQSGVQLYTYDLEGNPHKQSSTISDNLCTATVGASGTMYFAVVRNTSAIRRMGRNPILYLALVLCVLVAGCIIFVKRYKSPKRKRDSLKKKV